MTEAEIAMAEAQALASLMADLDIRAEMEKSGIA